MKLAEDRFLETVDLNINSIDSLEQTAKSYFNQSQYEEALKTYRRLLEMNPSNPEYYNDIWCASSHDEYGRTGGMDV